MTGFTYLNTVDFITILFQKKKIHTLKIMKVWIWNSYFTLTCKVQVWVWKKHFISYYFFFHTFLFHTFVHPWLSSSRFASALPNNISQCNQIICYLCISRWRIRAGGLFEIPEFGRTDYSSKLGVRSLFALRTIFGPAA